MVSGSPYEILSILNKILIHLIFCAHTCLDLQAIKCHNHCPCKTCENPVHSWVKQPWWKEPKIIRRLSYFHSSRLQSSIGTWSGLIATHITNSQNLWNWKLNEGKAVVCCLLHALAMHFCMLMVFPPSSLTLTQSSLGRAQQSHSLLPFDWPWPLPGLPLVCAPLGTKIFAVQCIGEDEGNTALLPFCPGTTYWLEVMAVLLWGTFPSFVNQKNVRTNS